MPATVRAIIVRGLAAKPGDRWPHLDAMLAALERELEPPRRPWRLIVAVAAAVVAAAVAIAFVIAARHTDRRDRACVVADPVARGARACPRTAGSRSRPTDSKYAISPRGRTWSLKSPEPAQSLDRARCSSSTTTGSCDGRITTTRASRGTGRSPPRPTPFASTISVARGSVPMTEGDLVARPATVDLMNAGKILRTWPRRTRSLRRVHDLARRGIDSRTSRPTASSGTSSPQTPRPARAGIRRRSSSPRASAGSPTTRCSTAPPTARSSRFRSTTPGSARRSACITSPRAGQAACSWQRGTFNSSRTCPARGCVSSIVTTAARATSSRRSQPRSSAGWRMARS